MVKKFLLAMVGILVMSVSLLTFLPQLALGSGNLGISPSTIDISIGSKSSVDFWVHYYEGIIDVSFVGVPLRVEPSKTYVSATTSPQLVTLSVYNDSLPTGSYKGTIRIVGNAGNSVSMAINISTTVSVGLTATVVSPPWAGSSGGGGGSPTAPPAVARIPVTSPSPVITLLPTQTPSPTPSPILVPGVPPTLPKVVTPTPIIPTITTLPAPTAVLPVTPDPELLLEALTSNSMVVLVIVVMIVIVIMLVLISKKKKESV